MPIYGIKSHCCNADMTTKGDCQDRHPHLIGKCKAIHTMHYECKKCKKPCNPIT